MKSISRICSAGFLALVLIASAIPAAAQDGAKMDQAAIQRSWDIQAQIAKIDQDKRAFIDQQISSWLPFVDLTVYGNPETELRPLMEQATPWTLYAASLVGDYNGMVQVLSGRVNPGTVINTLNTPQAHAFSGSPLALGGNSDNLVFYPIAPCRMVDTRGTGARTGAIAAAIVRTFDLTTVGYGKGEGGATSGCTGLPSISPAAWSANITVTGYGGSGFLQVYPYLGSVPATSIINFTAPSAAIANAGTVTGCYNCADDINVLASSPTHLVVDVYGYFASATGFGTGVATVFAGTTISVPSGSYTFVAGAACPGGTSLIGGAQANTGNSVNNAIATSDHGFSGGAWYEYARNYSGVALNVTVYSICETVK